MNPNWWRNSPMTLPLPLCRTLSVYHFCVWKFWISKRCTTAPNEREREKQYTHIYTVKFAVGQMQMCVCRTLHSVSRIGWGYWLCCLSFLVGQNLFFHSVQCAFLVSKTDHKTGCNPKIRTHTHTWRTGIFGDIHTCTITMHTHTRAHTEWDLSAIILVRLFTLLDSFGMFGVWICIGMHIWCCCNFFLFFFQNKHIFCVCFLF